MVILLKIQDTILMMKAISYSRAEVTENKLKIQTEKVNQDERTERVI